MFSSPSVPSDVVSIRTAKVCTKLRPQMTCGSIRIYHSRGLANGKVLFLLYSRWGKGGHDLCFRPHHKSSAHDQWSLMKKSQSPYMFSFMVSLSGLLLFFKSTKCARWSLCSWENCHWLIVTIPWVSRKKHVRRCLYDWRNFLQCIDKQNQSYEEWWIYLAWHC